MIIHCPECQGKVSSMAGTCPHCGMRIAGNIKQCHSCGIFCLNSATECPECHATLSVVVEEEILPEQPEAATPEPEQPARPLHRHRSPWIVSAVVCLILACGGAYYLQQRYFEDKEEQAYLRLEGVTNPEFYQQFLVDYPESKHVAEVTERIMQLQSELDDWTALQTKRNRADILRFMQQYVASPRLALCEAMIDSIDWAETQQLDTEEAIDSYLQAHPNGEHAAEAAEKKNALLLKRITPQERGMLRGFLEAFFTNAMANQDEEAVAAVIPERMTDFCGKADADAAAIIAYGKEKRAADVIGLHYSVMEGMNVRKESLPDGSIGYVVDCNIEETITRSDVHQPTKHVYGVSASVSQDKKMTKLNIR